MIEPMLVELSVSLLDDPSQSAGAPWRDAHAARSSRTKVADSRSDHSDVGVETIRGCHMRAARALLDWSMTVMAESSGVSISTVKRLEESVEPHALRSRAKVVATLRRSGIRFVTLEDGIVAVALAAESPSRGPLRDGRSAIL